MFGKILKSLFYYGSLYEGAKKYKVFRFFGVSFRFRVKFCKNTKEFVKNHRPRPLYNFVEPKRSKVYVSIVAIFKDEPDIIDWINYHLLVGVERFYLYDNESEEKYYEMLKPYIEKGIVVYKKVVGKCLQIPAYCDAVFRYKNETEWLAIIDLDEYIIPVEKDNLADFLYDYEDSPAVVANWVIFDSNGLKERPKDKFVIEAYTRRHKDIQNNDNKAVKSIVRPNWVRYVTIHACFYKNNGIAVDENHQKNISSLYFKTMSHSVKKIRINHYYCKSEEDYMLKISRGFADQNILRGYNINAVNYSETAQDYVALKYLDRLKNLKILQKI